MWTISPGGQVAVNGLVDPTTARVTALAYENGVIWQENADRLWWSKTSPSAPWSPTYGTTRNPIQSGVPVPGITYLDGAAVFYTNAVTPAAYNVTAVDDGDKGISFNYAGSDTNNGAIRNAEGVLALNINGTLTQAGSILTQGGIGAATTNVFIGGSGTLLNTGTITVAASSNVHNTMWIELTTTGTTFQNNKLIEADGTGQTINIWSASSGPHYDSNAVNNGVISVTGGAYAFVMAPLITSTGSGAIDVSGGSRAIFDAPVGPNETVSISSGVLEFGSPNGLTNPAMQFLGKIDGNLVGSTVLLDGVYATSKAFKVDSAAGAGLGELLAYDQTHAMVADLRFVGHYQQADFSLSQVAASTPANDYTALTFSPHPNTPGIVHS